MTVQTETFNRRRPNSKKLKTKNQLMNKPNQKTGRRTRTKEDKQRTVIKKISCQIRFDQDDGKYFLLDKPFAGKPAVQLPCAKWEGNGPLGAAHRTSAKIQVSAGLNLLSTIIYKEDGSNTEWHIGVYYGSGDTYWKGEGGNILKMKKEEIEGSALLTPMSRFIFQEFLKLSEKVQSL